MTSTDTHDITPRRMAALLRSLGACSEGRDWLAGRDLGTAWNECPRGDWLLWFAARIGVDRPTLARAAAKCAETALQYVPEGEDRPRLAIEAVLRWADDPTDVNLEAVRVARRNAAYDAADAAYDAAAAAAYAADAAYAYDAAYAADAAVAAAYAADAAVARREARLKAQERHAAIVRELIPFALIVTAVQARNARRAR
jgi:hypothetical protein